MSDVRARLGAHFMALTAAAGALASFGATGVEGAIVHAPNVNLPINADSFGLYLNFVTGVSGPTAASVPGWDINPFIHVSAGPAMYSQPVPSFIGGVVSNTFDGGPIDLVVGTFVGSFSTFDTGVAPASAAALGDPMTFGFRFVHEGFGQPRYAWARMRLPQSGLPGIIYEYAYEDSGGAIGVGNIPGPGVMSLLAMGVAGRANRRRSINLTPQAM